MLLIYVPRITSRLQYVLQLFFGELIKVEYSVTTSPEEFSSSAFPKLNYSKQKLSAGCFLLSDDLLFEEGIHEQKVSVGEWKSIKTLFSHREESVLSFDPFAAAFYLTTRYEEYFSFTPDEHGRFPDRENTAFKNGFHEIPVVNHYAMFLKEILQQQFPHLQFYSPDFQFLLTYDIDFAFAFRNKGWYRNAGGFAKSFLKGNLGEIEKRWKVLFENENDPFDTFSFQDSLHKKRRLDPVYFFLLGNHSKFDRGISQKNKEFRHLIRTISDRYQTGIHASYASDNLSQALSEEIRDLEEITGKKVYQNRQHFLKLRFPHTYQNLLDNGITEDYTMGFASLVGFRAGIASPFNWYDLSKEETTILRIFPFAVMDATLHYYLKLSADEAFNTSYRVMNNVRQVGGTFQFLAHNDLMAEQGVLKGWREKFEQLVSAAPQLKK